MRRRIFLTILAVAVVAVILFGVPLAIAVERRNRSVAVLELQRIASTAASQIPDGFASNAAGIQLTAVEPSVHLALYDTGGRLIAGSGPAQPDQVVRAAADGTVHDGHVGDELVVAVPVAHDDQIRGELRASEASDDATDLTYHTWIAMGALAVTVVVMATVAGSLLARRLTRPVQRLRDAAVRLGEGDFTVTPPMSGVAELDDAASALATTAQRLGDLVERERAFSADASHQLRTPLASLRLAIETELVQPRPDPTLVLNDALRDVDRLEATMTDLLALARDAPKDRQPVDLGVLLARVDTTWHARLAASGRPLHVRVDPATPQVLISSTALSTVVDVLVENAARHGRGAVSIEATPARPAGAVIVVTDEGHLGGDRGALFQRRSPHAKGHGIGLALARSLAHAEGARLQLARIDPTTFEVLIAAEVPSGANDKVTV